MIVIVCRKQLLQSCGAVQTFFGQFPLSCTYDQSKLTYGTTDMPEV